jgi:hypothetical protein
VVTPAGSCSAPAKFDPDLAESGKEFTRVAKRSDSGGFPVATQQSPRKSKSFINQDLSGTTHQKSNKFENRPNIAEVSWYHCGFTYTYGFP